MPEARFWRGTKYIISNESKVAFTAKEWNAAEIRYRKILAESIAQKV
jgi:hypothetical protein